MANLSSINAPGSLVILPPECMLQISPQPLSQAPSQVAWRMQEVLMI